jgi:hypothetical protein
MGGMGHLDRLEDVRVIREAVRGHRSILLSGQSKGKNDGSLREVLLRGHLFRDVADLKVNGAENGLWYPLASD